ncbi:MAG: glycosyltransferase family 39 protein [Actinomycetota bacterium]
MNQTAEQPRRFLNAIVAWTAGVALALGIFDLFSARSDLARRGWLVSNGDRLARPPIYGQFAPHITRWVLAAIGVALVAGGLAWLAGRPRFDRRAFLAATTLVFFGFATAVAFVAGDRVEASIGMRAEPDARVVDEIGLRTFVRDYPELVGEQVHSVHSLTHPPGRPILAWVLGKAFGDHPLAKSVAVAALSSLVIIPAWLLAREKHGERAAQYAVALLATAPGPILFAFASFEALEAVALVTAGWLFVRSLRGAGDPRWAAAAGAVLGGTMFFTYSAAIVGAFLGLYAILTKPRATVVRVLGGATAGGLGALALLYVALGFDPFATSTGTRRFNAALGPCPDPPPPGTGPCTLPRSYRYWLAGAPAGWLTLAGVPLAALSLRELIAGRSRFLAAMILPNLVLYVLPRDVTGLLAGELERTVLWAYPFVAAAVAPTLERVSGERAGRALIVALALCGAAQAITIEGLYRTGW